MTRKTALEKAAEAAFDKWWAKEDRYHCSHQIASPEAFAAGARWQKRRDLGGGEKPAAQLHMGQRLGARSNPKGGQMTWDFGPGSGRGLEFMWAK